MSRGEEVTLTMEKRGVCLSIRIPPVKTGNLDAGTKGTQNSVHQDDSRVKKSPEHPLNSPYNPLNKARKPGFSSLFPDKI